MNSNAEEKEEAAPKLCSELHQEIDTVYAICYLFFY